MAKPKDMKALVDAVKSTRALLTHYQSSLAPSRDAAPTCPPVSAELANPLDVITATTSLLKSHTTTLSLLLVTPPLTPSAIVAKMGDVSAGVLGSMVAAASYKPQAGQHGYMGSTMHTEVKAHVWRLLGTCGDVLALILKMAEKRQTATRGSKDTGPSESERQEVLAATAIVWDACDALLKLCAEGVVALVVKKAGELRAVLLDAIEELQEWGEDVGHDGPDEGHGSDDEVSDDEDMFGPSNKLGKDDKQLKDLLDISIKKLKMVGMLYQALAKRRLKTFPAPSASITAHGANNEAVNHSKKLDDLMALLKAIPATVDDLASAFYDLDETEVKDILGRCCGEAKSAAKLVEQSWFCTNDEFTAWSSKWVGALDAVGENAQ